MLIAAAVVLVVIVAVGGALLARDRADNDAQASPSVSNRPTVSVTPSTSPAHTASSSPAVTATPSPSGPLPDGRSFVVLVGTADEALKVDLAYFYTDQEAIDQAAAHGDPPPENGYYIVNENPRIRTVPVSGSATVRYIPTDPCCDLKRGTVDGLMAAVAGTAPTDYPDMRYTPWWVTVEDGEIVAIQQQFLP